MAVSEETLRRSMERVRSHGQTYRTDFERLVAMSGGGDLNYLLARGAICVDVGDGPEVVAFGESVPRGTFFVAESSRDEESWQILSSFKDEFGLSLINASPEEVLSGLARTGVGSMGLVTWTNVYPSSRARQLGRRIGDFLSGSANLLSHEGLAVVSGHRSVYDGDVWWEEMFSEIARLGVQGLELQVEVDGKRTTTGEYYLVGRRIGI